MDEIQGSLWFKSGDEFPNGLPSQTGYLHFSYHSKKINTSSLPLHQFLTTCQTQESIIQHLISPSSITLANKLGPKVFDGSNGSHWCLFLANLKLPLSVDFSKRGWTHVPTVSPMENCHVYETLKIQYKMHAPIEWIDKSRWFKFLDWNWMARMV